VLALTSPVVNPPAGAHARAGDGAKPVSWSISTNRRLF